MVEAGISAIKQAPDVGGICAEYTAEAYDAYTAMLAAAPPAPVVEVTKATCAKVARANVDARLAAAPDEILESATAIGKEEGGMSTSDEPREVAADLRTLSRFMHQAADAIWRLRLGAECEWQRQFPGLVDHEERQGAHGVSRRGLTVLDAIECWIYQHGLRHMGEIELARAFVGLQGMTS